MVRWFFLVLVSCATVGSDAERATAPMKRSPLPLELVGPCGERPSPEAARAPSWESLVLAGDVETWNRQACAPLEQALTPLEQTDLSRPTLRAECEAKAAALSDDVRSACRAGCAAKRWLAGRELGRRRAREALTWFRDHLDEAFDRLLACPAMPKRFPGQLDDLTTRAFFECVGVKGLPRDVEFTLQFVTESVSWQTKAGKTFSARVVEVQGLLVKSLDENLPWRATVGRCHRGGRLDVVMGDY